MWVGEGVGVVGLPVCSAFPLRFAGRAWRRWTVQVRAGGPVVAVNSPDFREGKENQIGTKHGTVGLPIPGVAVRIVDLDTKEPLPPGSEGMLLVKAPGRMLGYLNQPERTAEVFQGDWYITGDMVKVDEDGFVSITDRISRFSKVGGEMVPHLLVEDMISKACGDAPCAVTGLPDDRKGERLAVLYTDPGLTPEELWRRLAETDLPKLWLPKLENIHRVEELPLLGTGKLDLRRVRTLAQELSGGVDEKGGQDALSTPTLVREVRSLREGTE